jgi:hypothetical protein
VRQLERGLHLRKWRLEHRIGRGGDGDVWMAAGPRGQKVALKIRPHTDDEEAQRFRKEFERLRTLHLPGVIRVLDTGADQGYIYFAMELAQGVPFDRYVAAGHHVSERVTRAVTAGAQIASILASMHRLHLAHRDLKPANIQVDGDLVDRSVQVTLLDFGTHRFGSLRDDTGSLQGTPAYMAPEQRLGLPHDHRADCYALGVVLHEAISAQPASAHTPGRRRTSLAHLDSAVPLAVADLVDGLLRLDPAARPTAARADAILEAIVRGQPLPPAPWPHPIHPTGDPAPLLQGHAVIVGACGSGRARRVSEARWQWYRKGYPSVAGQCEPDRPYGAWRQVLDELFREQDPALRRRLAGKDAAVLQTIWPQLPVSVKKPRTAPPGPLKIAKALAALFRRSAPVAIVLWDADQADPGTKSVLNAIADCPMDEVRLWATSTDAVPGFPTVAPPTWDRSAMAAMWADIAPDTPPPDTLPDTPLDGLADAWTAFAKSHSLPQPPYPLPPGLIRLVVLHEPFPRKVAVRVAPDLDLLIRAGHIAPVDTNAPQSHQRLRFCSAATRALARQSTSNRIQDHRLALTAWEAQATTPDAIWARVHHGIRGGVDRSDLIDDMIRAALDRGSATEIRRWLDMRDLRHGRDSIGNPASGFVMSYARLYTALRLEPNRVTQADLRALAASATTPEHRALAAHLKLVHCAKGDDRVRMAREGRKWARSLANHHPALAARILRETALVHLTEGALGAALKDAETAVELARSAARTPVENGEEVTELDRTQPALTVPIRLTQSEVISATTHAAALVYAGQPKKADEVCKTMAVRCREDGNVRGEAAFLINRAIALLRTGDRVTASECLALARPLHHEHGDPNIISNWATIAARLAVERGDLQAGTRLIDEAITAAQATNDDELLAEMWAVCLDAATQAADAGMAQRALSTYGTESIWSAHDHWPAALARWHWAIGDIEGALAATDTSRLAFGGFCVQAERARMLLLSGDTRRAISCATALFAQPGISAHGDLVLFLQLVDGAARSVRDADYVPLVSEMRDRQWVHLYLGALHLDAIRRRRRGENVAPVLRQLESRSVDIDHAVYCALARARGW